MRHVMPTEPLNAARLQGYIGRARRALWPGLTLAVLRALAIAPCPLILKHIVDHEVPTSNARGVLLWSSLFAGLMGVHYLGSILGARQLAQALARLMVELRSRIFFRLQFLSFSYLDRQKTDRLVSKYTSDTQAIEALLSAILNQLLPAVLSSLTILTVLAVINWRLATAFLVTLPVWAFAKWLFFARLQRSDQAAQIAEAKLTGTANEFISALRLVRSLGEEKHLERVLFDRSGDFARSRADHSWMSAGFASFSYVGAQTIAALIVGGGALLAIRGHMTPGTLVAFLAALPMILAPVQSAIGLRAPWFAAQESYKKVKELIDSPYVEDWHGARREQRLSGDLVFDRVGFTYPGTDHPAIRNFSFTIRPGETVALVGPPGAGKTTLTNLLLGLYAPTTGQIVIDGVPQREWDMRWIRRQLAVVTPESIMLSGTIEENIRFARSEATDAEVRTAARLAQADDFIQRLPHGYLTLVGEHGVALTAEQRQYLAIARAALRDAPILILDEATSALDSESAGPVQLALERLAAGRTVITLAHRLSAVKKASRIVLLDGGNIIDEGDYAALTARHENRRESANPDVSLG